MKSGIPLFKSHERTDPATGELIRVDEQKLHRIANNMRKAEAYGRPVKITLGHTDPQKPETQQPPVAGYFRNARVQRHHRTGEPMIYGDEWLDPQYGQHRKNYPFRSAEYYNDVEDITAEALLTRDPFLDMGIVAYSRGQDVRPYGCGISGDLIHCTAPSTQPIRYALNPATGRYPVMYQLHLGELPMFPQNPQYPPSAVAGPAYAPPPNPMHYAVTPPPSPYGRFVPPGAPGGGYAQLDANGQPIPGAPLWEPAQVPVALYDNQPQPTPYGMPPAGYGAWPGPPHHMPPMAHPHHDQRWAGGMASRAGYPKPQGGHSPAPGGHYGRGPMRPSRYAGEPPMGPGGGGNPLEMVYEAIMAAAQGIQQLMEGMSQAPQEPFPPEGGGGPGGEGGPPMMGSRYGRQPQRRPGPPRPYGAPGQLTPYGPQPQQPPTTISGLPVGYQLKVDQLNYQLDAQNRAISTLMKERDESDTAECVAEIRRLAQAGYPVGDEEVFELKKTPRQYRYALLERIATKYQKVPTDQPPPILGDPTPGPVENMNRRTTQEEMEAALKLSETPPFAGDKNGFTNALNYIRSGGSQGQPTMYGQPPMGPQRLMPPGPQPNPVADYMNQFAWGEGAQAPGMPGAFRDPYPEPSGNGRY